MTDTSIAVFVRSVSQAFACSGISSDFTRPVIPFAKKIQLFCAGPGKSFKSFIFCYFFIIKRFKRLANFVPQLLKIFLIVKVFFIPRGVFPVRKLLFCRSIEILIQDLPPTYSKRKIFLIRTFLFFLKFLKEFRALTFHGD